MKQRMVADACLLVILPICLGLKAITSAPEANEDFLDDAFCVSFNPNVIPVECANLSISTAIHP